jgi:hypothetical protein
MRSVVLFSCLLHQRSPLLKQVLHRHRVRLSRPRPSQSPCHYSVRILSAKWFHATRRCHLLMSLTLSQHPRRP